MHEHELQLGSDVEMWDHSPATNDDDDEEEEEADLTTEQQVEEALQNLGDVPVVMTPTALEEEEMVAQFRTVGCGCHRKCSSQFSHQHIQDMRAQCFELTHTELDMVILGQLVASTNTSSDVAVESRHLKKERQELQHFPPFWQDCVWKNISFSAHNRQQEAQKPCKESKGEWVNTSCARQHTQTPSQLTFVWVH